MLRKYALYFSWVLACIGLLSSLYFSNIKNLEPCHLCWFQRIALFPLSILLGIATYRGDRDIARYALPLVVVGLLFAGYQIAIQEIPGWNPIEICGGGPSCEAKTEIGLGFVTIPMLAAANFTVLGALLIKAWPSNK